MAGNKKPNRHANPSKKQREREALKKAKKGLMNTMAAALEYQKAVAKMVAAAQSRVDGLGNVLHDVKDVLDEIRKTFEDGSDNAILIDAALVSIEKEIKPEPLPPTPVHPDPAEMAAQASLTDSAGKMVSADEIGSPTEADNDAGAQAILPEMPPVEEVKETVAGFGEELIAGAKEVVL